MIYDELDEQWNIDGYKENEYGELWYLDDEFDSLFNNKASKQKYIVNGTLDLWDGNVDVESVKAYDSIKEAIQSTMDSGICYLQVYEAKYGKLYVDVIHHDGRNHFEIRELTKIGNQLLNQYNYNGNIHKRKDATRNVKFLRRYH